MVALRTRLIDEFSFAWMNTSILNHELRYPHQRKKKKILSTRSFCSANLRYCQFCIDYWPNNELIVMNAHLLQFVHFNIVVKIVIHKQSVIQTNPAQKIHPHLSQMRLRTSTSGSICPPVRLFFIRFLSATEFTILLADCNCMCRLSPVRRQIQQMDKQ